MHTKRYMLPWLTVILVLPFILPIQPAQADPGLCTAANASTRPECTQRNIHGIEMRALMAEMSAHPVPDVTRLAVDDRLLFSRAYRKVVQPGPIHDAPNGNIVGQLDKGFQFVNAGRIQDGWVEIRAGQWVPDNMLGPVNKAVSRFSGVLLPDGIPTRPFAWVLLDTKPSRTPGARPLPNTPILKRYTLVNIFAVRIIDSWEWYLIGPDQWVVQTRVAKIKPVVRPERISGKWFAVDLYEQTLVAYEENRAVFATLISSGLENWSTNEGVFRIWDRHQQVRMSGAAGQPEFWFLPEVPYVMYFNQSEQALHGAYWHDGFGYRRSRGCVNMSITDSKWIYEWTLDAPDAWVYVYHSGEYRSGAPL